MNEVTSELFKRLDAIGAKLGVPADQVWGTLIKQAAIEGRIDTVIAVVAGVIALASIFTIVAVLLSKKRAENGEFAFLGFFVGLISVFIFFSYLTDAMTEIYNPQYFALHRITAMLRDK